MSAIQDSLQWDLEQAADHANLLHVVFLHRLHFYPVGSGNGGAGCTDRDGAGECSDPSAQASVNVEDAGAGDNITGSIGVNGTGDWRGTAGRASGHDRLDSGHGKLATGVDGAEQGRVKPVNHLRSYSKSSG